MVTASVYNDTNPEQVPWTEIELHMQPSKSMRKYSKRNKYQESNLEDHNFEEQV